MAVFGQKDLQQLLVIRRITADLSLPVKIIGVPTARNGEGLALSSRNGYLSQEQLKVATYLYETLKNTKQQIEAGRRDYSTFQEESNQLLEAKGFQRDYFHICRQHDLHSATDHDRDFAILAAVRLGPARLIDNLRFSI